MKPCPHKHVEARFWSRHFRHWRVIPMTMMAVNPDALVCRDCNAWLAVGESEETKEAVAIEIRLAALLAEYGCEYEGEALDEVHEVLVPIFADDTPPPPNPNLRKPGPRSPIEMMVDRACGIATHEGES